MSLPPQTSLPPSFPLPLPQSPIAAGLSHLGSRILLSVQMKLWEINLFQDSAGHPPPTLRCSLQARITAASRCVVMQCLCARCDNCASNVMSLYGGRPLLFSEPVGSQFPQFIFSVRFSQPHLKDLTLSVLRGYTFRLQPESARLETQTHRNNLTYTYIACS